jgi:hypothetical protein
MLNREIKARHDKERHFRQILNSHVENGRCLLLHAHAITGQPVILPPNGIWAEGVTTPKVCHANGKDLH